MLNVRLIIFGSFCPVEIRFNSFGSSGLVESEVERLVIEPYLVWLNVSIKDFGSSYVVEIRFNS